MPEDVIDLILRDHRELERLLDALAEQPDRRPELLPELTGPLIAHGRAEEAEVHPAARIEADEEDEEDEVDEVAHGRREHVHFELLLERLQGAPKDSPRFDTLLRELTEVVRDHVEDEESTVLPGVRESIDPERRAELGGLFLARRERHLSDRPGQATHEERHIQAENAGIEGRSGMSKEELEERVRSL